MLQDTCDLMFATDDSFVLVQIVYPIYSHFAQKSWTICVIEIRDSFYFPRHEQSPL